MSVRSALVMLLAVLLAACGGGGGSERRTAIDLVDKVIESVEARDVEAIVSLTQPSETPCIALPRPDRQPVPPAGHFLACDAGVADGTLVATFLSVGCEGAFAVVASEGATELRSVLDSADPGVYAVYAPKDAWAENERLGLIEYAVMLTRAFEDRRAGVALLVGDDGIVGTDTDCGYPPDQMAERYGETILPPLQTNDEQPATSD